MKNIKQAGFSVVEGLLILVIIGMLGFTGWFMWNSQQNVDKTNNSAVTNSQVTDTNTVQAYKRTTTVPSDWKKYTNAKYGFSFSYPSSWTLAERSIAPTSKPNLAFDAETMTYFTNGGAGVKSSFVVSVYKSNLNDMLKAETKEYTQLNSGKEVNLNATRLTFDGHNAATFNGPIKNGALKSAYLISANGYIYECSLYSTGDNEKVVPVDQNVVKQFESLKFN